MKITVIDYGLSNLLSVRRAFEYFGAEVEVTGSRSRILSAKALVLPGVGAFKDGMAGLSGLSLADAIADKCAVGTPLLGICLGMQMLFDESDEFGRHRGLGHGRRAAARAPCGMGARSAAAEAGRKLQRNGVRGCSSRRGAVFRSQL